MNMKRSIFADLLNDDDFNALSNTVRWNGTTRLKEESVAHHSFFVSWMARILSEEMFVDEKIKLEITTFALFHDFDEMFSGDIIHTVKYNDINGEKWRKAIDEFCKHSVEKKFASNTKMNNLYKKYLIHDDLPTYQKNIVKICDWYAMLFYVNKEIKIGNTSLIPIFHLAVKKMKEKAEQTINDMNITCDLQILLDLIGTKFEL